MSQKQEEENPGEETGKEKQDTQEKEGTLPERAKETKLKAKCLSLGQKLGGSDFLMKRLQRGQKYFDSGDYDMPKAKMKNKQLPSTGQDKNLVTRDHVPNPQDLPQRKSSLITSKLARCLQTLTLEKALIGDFIKLGKFTEPFCLCLLPYLSSPELWKAAREKRARVASFSKREHLGGAEIVFGGTSELSVRYPTGDVE
ncbi:LOW QUALITY PROTEIN: alpha-endosulfine-like [Phocoena sinus]|uniref:LOW QUALITY PROTEIN: alpha-endosulfine-like n=1 Tax=Phocoena sinus TaxID=42100 RepID=UPI0013C46F10|nr:LOW QUALITY PROTEIN: alpha-endosulfine-like [Phocoena sinus]